MLRKLSLLSLCLCSVAATKADEVTWIGTTKDWSEPSNWSSDPTLPSAGDVVIFTPAWAQSINHTTGDTVIQGLQVEGRQHFITVREASSLTVTGTFDVSGGGLFTSSGEGSLFDLSAMTSITRKSGASLQVNVNGGGKVDLSGLQSVVNGNENEHPSVSFSSGEPGSLLDLSSLQDLTGIGSVSVSGGGEVLWNSPTSTSGTNITISNGGKLDTSSLTDISSSSIRVSDATTQDFSLVTSADDALISITNSSVAMPIQAYAFSGSNEISARGADSLLDLSSLKTITAINPARRTVSVGARDGAKVDLSSLQTFVRAADAGKLTFTVEREGSLIDASMLQDFSQTELTVVNGGEIRWNSPTTIDNSNITIGVDAKLDTSSLTELTNSIVEVRNQETSATHFSNVTNADNSTLYAGGNFHLLVKPVCCHCLYSLIVALGFSKRPVSAVCWTLHRWNRSTSKAQYP